MQVYHAFVFSTWPPVEVNIVYFLVHIIDGLGGGYRRNTPKREAQDAGRRTLERLCCLVASNQRFTSKQALVPNWEGQFK